MQGYPPFAAKYSGPNSLPTGGQIRDTVSVDLFAGARLWRGAEAHLDILGWQGNGLHDTLGIDDFPNGEAYKAGTTYPRLNLAQLFIHQTIGLGGEQENARMRGCFRAWAGTTDAIRRGCLRTLITLDRLGSA